MLRGNGSFSPTPSMSLEPIGAPGDWISLGAGGSLHLKEHLLALGVARPRGKALDPGTRFAGGGGRGEGRGGGTVFPKKLRESWKFHVGALNDPTRPQKVQQLKV